MLARLEAGLVEQTRSDGPRIQREQRQLEAALAEIWQTREERRQRDRTPGDLHGRTARPPCATGDRAQGIKNQLLELSLNEQKLTYVLEDLEQQRAERDGRPRRDDRQSLARLAGELEWPVQGELIRGFGRSVHPAFKTVTLNNGVNIAAPLGAPVAAVADGHGGVRR